jgi:Flp pilus assembly protein TadD
LDLRKRTFVGLLCVLFLALVVRVIYIHQLKDNPFFTNPVVDSLEYHNMAVKISKGESPRDDAFYQPPLYPYFLGFLYRIFGTDFFTIRFLQMLLGVINVLLTYLLARRIFGCKTALACGVILALYGTMLFFEGELLAPVLIVFLNLLLILSLLWFLAAPGWRRALLCGFILGASAITMAVILPFAVAALVYYFILLRKKKGAISLQKMIVMGLCFVLGISVAVLPVTLYNWKKGDDFVLVSSNAGINFYLGTGKDFEKKIAIRPGYEWKDLMREPLNAGYKKASRQSTYYFKKALKLIFHDPLGYLLGTVKKIYIFANGNEVMRNQEIYPFRRHSSLLSVLLWKKGLAFPYGLLFPLAVLGAIFSLTRKKQENYLLLLFSASHIVIIVLFFVTARYKMNILPFLIILAVYGAMALFDLFRERVFVKAGVYSGLLVVLLVLCNWNVGTMPTDFNADAYFNLGVNYMEKGLPGAKTMFEKAIEQDPGFLDAYGNLGILRDTEGDHGGAVGCFEKVLARYADDIEANSHLGIAYYHLGDLSKARGQFIKVLALDKNNETARYNLEIVDKKIHRERAATLDRLMDKFQAQLRDDPENPVLLSNLGMIYIMKKDYGKALTLLQKAVVLDPRIPQAHNSLGIVLLELGRVAEARSEFETALKLKPDYESPKKNLQRLEKIKK